MKFMKIKVIKCSSEKYWYNDKIGQEFTVAQSSIRDYYVSDNGRLKGILVCDTELINEKRED